MHVDVTMFIIIKISLNSFVAIESEGKVWYDKKGVNEKIMMLETQFFSQIKNNKTVEIEI
jgi:hypothetical protein